MTEANAVRLRLAFLGVGWIGRHRMEAIIRADVAEVIGVADASAEAMAQALALAPAATQASSLDELLALRPDGVVIATPSALHAEQSIQALQAGAAVFCQKPLGRTAGEVKAVCDAARAADRLLGVDLSYRYTEGMRQIGTLIRTGELGRIFAIDLTFHNAYGPDKPWFYDQALSGGGCVMDLGVHLVDLALSALDFPAVRHVSSQLFAQGLPLAASAGQVEDYAVATIELETGAVVRLACSWRLHAGREAIIAASFHGTSGGAEFRNVKGSFYDFTAERFDGTHSTPLAVPPDDWGGRAACDWAARLAAGERFSPAADQFVEVAKVLDLIYWR